MTVSNPTIGGSGQSSFNGGGPFNNHGILNIGPVVVTHNKPDDIVNAP
jgi:hypothetical protein